MERPKILKIQQDLGRKSLIYQNLESSLSSPAQPSSSSGLVMWKKELSIHALLCKVAGTQDHARTCSHSHHPTIVEELRETAPTPQEAVNPPPVSFQHPLLLPSYSPSFPFSNPAPGLLGGHLQRSLSQQSHGPPHGCVPPCPYRHGCQGRNHASRPTIPPDAGREKLNKTPWWGDINKDLSRCSWGS